VLRFDSPNVCHAARRRPTTRDELRLRSARSVRGRGRPQPARTLESGLAVLRQHRSRPASNLISRVDPNLRAAGLALSFLYQFNRLSRIARPISGDIAFEYGRRAPRRTRPAE